jgi:hypothetical protein
MRSVNDFSTAREVDPMAIQVSAETDRALPCFVLCTHSTFCETSLRPSEDTGPRSGPQFDILPRCAAPYRDLGPLSRDESKTAMRIVFTSKVSFPEGLKEPTCECTDRAAHRCDLEHCHCSTVGVEQAIKLTPCHESVPSSSGPRQENSPICKGFIE